MNVSKFSTPAKRKKEIFTQNMFRLQPTLLAKGCVSGLPSGLPASSSTHSQRRTNFQS
jgi:hypothetical protein